MILLVLVCSHKSTAPPKVVISFHSRVVLEVTTRVWYWKLQHEYNQHVCHQYKFHIPGKPNSEKRRDWDRCGHASFKHARKKTKQNCSDQFNTPSDPNLHLYNSINTPKCTNASSNCTNAITNKCKFVCILYNSII